MTVGTGCNCNPGPSPLHWDRDWWLAPDAYQNTHYRKKTGFSLPVFLASEETRACIFSLGNVELIYFSQLMHSFLD